MTKKMLVVYYSWSSGSTEGIAKQLARACGADIERIEISVPYPKDYDATVRQGKREVDEGFKPAIEGLSAILPTMMRLRSARRPGGTPWLRLSRRSFPNIPGKGRSSCHSRRAADGPGPSSPTWKMPPRVRRSARRSMRASARRAAHALRGRRATSMRGVMT